eukprot:scaffold1474_cov256-Pinguiococcus_pyrenoidosus.AAC.31
MDVPSVVEQAKPGGHGEHSDCPSTEKVPSAHAYDEERPASHDEHVDWYPRENVPGRQAAGAEDRDGQNAPLGHAKPGSHTVPFALTDGHSYPAGQAVHDVAFPSENVPAEQPLGGRSAAGHSMPMGQSLHETAPGSLYFPAGHATGAEVASEQAKPASQRRQRPDPARL